MMVTLIILAGLWIVFSVAVLLFASMASARFTQVEDSPHETQRRQTIRRSAQDLPAASMGQASVQN